MADLPPLDMDFVRSRFPGLSKGWTLFDNAGGSQILQSAVERINDFLLNRNVQIGGTYEVSQKAAEALVEARRAAQVFVNASRMEEIVFGPTTSALILNLASAMRSQLRPGDEIIVTIADHESNIGPWKRLEEFGIVVKFWPLNRDSWTLELDELRPLMNERTRLVCVNHVSNILGSINPIKAVAEFVHANGARICVDGVAYAPHRAIDVQEWDVDYYVFSLYKAFGPHHAVMYGKYECLLELDTLYHYFYGKDKVPGKLEPGNANYELSYTMPALVEYFSQIGAQQEIPGTDRQKLLGAFQAVTGQEDILVERLTSYLNDRPDCCIIGHSCNKDSARVPTIAFTLKGRDPAEMTRKMDTYKIAIRYGDFHSRRLIEYLELAKNNGVLRVSMVHYNTVDEVDSFVAALDEIAPAR